MNRTVIIAGPARGIGFSTAAEFLKNRGRVVIFGRHKEHVTGALNQLAGLGEGKDKWGLIGDVPL